MNVPIACMPLDFWRDGGTVKYMDNSASFEPIVIRCTGCMQHCCTVSCKRNAVIYIRGDLLLEAHKCGACEQYQAAAGPIPPCITRCYHATNKVVLEALSAAQKRTNSAEFLPLLNL
ncbi:MAG: hypothetical protein LBL76_08485 [Treponema sp.]|nr:hypothetical protein [Treponema sp.]